MVKQVDFALLVSQAMQAQNTVNMRPVVEKELLHYDILFCLDEAGLLEKLTFQGGTSLRLCYGAQRFSEDLDFVGGKDFSREHQNAIKDCVGLYLHQRYGLEVTVKEPAELRHEREHADLKIDKWQISVVTAPDRPDLPRQRVKLEVANIAAYSRNARPLQLNYPFLPDGYADTLVLVESLDEIMADKLVSLVNTGTYVRNRDIWDLRWLKQQGAHLRADWVQQKITDYRVDRYPAKLQSMINRIPELVHGQPFRQELLRFLPQDVLDRTLEKPRFCDFLAQELGTMLQELQSALTD